MQAEIITIGILDSGNLNIFNKWNNDIKKIIKTKLPNGIKISHYDSLSEIDKDDVNLNKYHKNILITRLKNCYNEDDNFNFIEYDDFLIEKDIQTPNDKDKDNIHFKNFDKDELNNLNNRNYIIFDFAHFFDIDEIKQYNIISLGYDSINKDYLLNNCFKIDDNNNIIIYSDIINKLILDFNFNQNKPDDFFIKYISIDKMVTENYIFQMIELLLNLKEKKIPLYQYEKVIKILELGIINNNLGINIMDDLYEIYNNDEKINYDIFFNEKYINPLIQDLKKFI